MRAQYRQPENQNGTARLVAKRQALRAGKMMSAGRRRSIGCRLGKGFSLKIHPPQGRTTRPFFMPALPFALNFPKICNFQRQPENQFSAANITKPH
ncbi:hypothetical protein GCWU000324_03078 [Kingella oralis ATCC 51147]|uniref:Uncharacterized protein n=1 Tax=Kingella oralis ATCC 51147 TaxID=629741 RepID=C4GMZ0_9NEIS|nr:hypothetical protein GCWU000324_03078 [Kingella oralis ATCC 51147]